MLALCPPRPTPPIPSVPACLLPRRPWRLLLRMVTGFNSPCGCCRSWPHAPARQRFWLHPLEREPQRPRFAASPRCPTLLPHLPASLCCLPLLPASRTLQEEDEDEDDVVWMTDTSEAARAKRAAEQLSAATAAMVTQVRLGRAGSLWEGKEGAQRGVGYTGAMGQEGRGGSAAGGEHRRRGLGAQGRLLLLPRGGARRPCAA